MKDRVILALSVLGIYYLYFRNKGEKCNCPKPSQSSCPGTPIFIPPVNVPEVKTTVSGNNTISSDSQSPKDQTPISTDILEDSTVYNGPSKFMKYGPPDIVYFTENNEFFKYNTTTQTYQTATKILKSEMISVYNSLNP